MSQISCSARPAISISVQLFSQRMGNEQQQARFSKNMVKKTTLKRTISSPSYHCVYGLRKNMAFFQFFDVGIEKQGILGRIHREMHNKNARFIQIGLQCFCICDNFETHQLISDVIQTRPIIMLYPMLYKPRLIIILYPNVIYTRKLEQVYH